MSRVGWLKLQAQALRTVETLSLRCGCRSRVAGHLLTGLRGEREALFHLRGLGYVVVARRWKSVRLRGDVDLIAWEGDCLCFIEVKTRTGHDPMEPAEAAVDSQKQEMLRRMARAYLRGFPRRMRSEVRVRFDVVSVYLQPGGMEFEVRRGVFGWE
ncbi:YraN family protein [Granulicella sp. dw_53]|uniref:YraN family protein n=1 Tax=Granulicella sp. dw_53 TaxID=2719792 RepID=UPI0031F65B5F